MDHRALSHTVDQFYSRALISGGDAGERVGWEGVALQQLRFEALLEAVDPEDFDGRLTLLDVGCGLGDLAGWLTMTGRKVTYLGIDRLPSMVEEARRRHPGYQFEACDVRDLQDTFDLVVCSGSLNYGVSDEEGWALINHMYTLTRGVTCIELLSERNAEIDPLQAGGFWLVSPVELFRQARMLCPRVVVREDVLRSDVLLYLYRGYHRSSRGPFRQVATPSHVAEIELSRGEPSLALARLMGVEDEAGEVHRVRGRALAELERTGEAVDELRKAHLKRPWDVEVATSLLWLLLDSRAIEDAEEVLNKVIEAGRLTPSSHDDLRFIVHYGEMLMRRLEQAKYLEHQAETSFGRSLLQGARLLREHHLEEARRILEEAHHHAPLDLRALSLLATTRHRQGDHVEAIHLAAEILRWSPRHKDARNVAMASLRAVQHQLERTYLHEILTPLKSHAVLGPVVLKLIKG